MKTRPEVQKVILLALFGFTIAACSKEDQIIPQSQDSIIERNSVVGAELKGPGLPSVTAYDPLYWVRLLVQNVQPASNFYNTQADSVTWTGQQYALAYFCSTDCSGLLTKLLKQSYGYSSTYFKTWTGKTNPYAANYYNEIVTQDHFTRINNIGQILQGDIIALKYPSGSSSTGHIMIADGPAIIRTATAPLVSGTIQYEIAVYDCSSSGHGNLDTRYYSGTWDEGAGRGIFRIYANSSGSILGYTWSTYSNSIYYSQSQRQLAVGRLIP